MKIMTLSWRVKCSVLFHHRNQRNVAVKNANVSDKNGIKSFILELDQALIKLSHLILSFFSLVIEGQGLGSGTIT